MSAGPEGTITLDTHYDVLGIHPLALPDEIRAAHRRLVWLFHPDRHATGNRAVARLSHDVMARINAAWTVLGDEERRAAYDRRVAGERPADHCHWPERSCTCGSGVPVAELRHAIGHQPG